MGLNEKKPSREYIGKEANINWAFLLSAGKSEKASSDILQKQMYRQSSKKSKNRALKKKKPNT